MQRINFTETTLNTLKRNANCSFANAVYKLGIKAQQGLKCDDLFKKSALMNEVNKLLCKYKLDSNIIFKPQLVAFSPQIEFPTLTTDITEYFFYKNGQLISDSYTNEDIVNYFRDLGYGGIAQVPLISDYYKNLIETTFGWEAGDYNEPLQNLYTHNPNLFYDLSNITGAGSLPNNFFNPNYSELTENNYVIQGTILDTYQLFENIEGSEGGEGFVRWFKIFITEEISTSYTEEELNCITPQDLQVLFEFTHKYKETLAKSTKKITNQTTSNSNSSSSDCCEWGKISGSIGNQSDLISYLNTIEKNLISVYDETTEITGDLKSLKFLGAGVTATNSAGEVSVTIPGGGGGGSGIDGIDGANSRRWKFLNAEFTPVSNGYITLRNNVQAVTLNPALGTSLRLNEFDNTNADLNAWLTALDTYTSTNPGKAYIQITKSSNNSIFGIYEVGQMAKISSYYQIGINHISSGGLFTDLDEITVSWVLFGADGSVGTTPTLQEVSDTGGLTNGTNVIEGPLGGIALLCTTNLTLEWFEGALYSLDGSGLINKVIFKTTLPTVNDDSTKNYKVNSFWQIDDVKIFKCTNASPGAAVWVDVTPGATNLGYTASPTNGIVTSDTGTDATISLADGTNAGLLKPAKFTVLENTSGTNTGDNATNTTSNTYADGKVADAITNGVTTIAPSQNAVFDALALLKIEEINLQDIGTALPASTYTFILEAKYARTINELTVDAGAGTCTLTMNINGTPVTGISAVSVSTTKTTYTATAANSIAINDLVTIVTSSNSGLENLQITVKTTRV